MNGHRANKPSIKGIPAKSGKGQHQQNLQPVPMRNGTRRYAKVYDGTWRAHHISGTTSSEKHFVVWSVLIRHGVGPQHRSVCPR